MRTSVMESLREDVSYTRGLILCVGLIQARDKHIGITDEVRNGMLLLS